MGDVTQELIERIEGASGPDRAIDFAILCLVDPRASKTGILPGDPKFTASLDAAMTLLPGDDWEWSLEVQAGHLPDDDLERMIAIVKVGDPSCGWESTAATPALALCAAALKARQTATNEVQHG